MPFTPQLARCEPDGNGNPPGCQSDVPGHSALSPTEFDCPALSGTEFLHPTRVAAGMKGFQSGPIETIEILVAFTPPEFDDTTSQLLGGPGETHLDASNR